MKKLTCPHCQSEMDFIGFLKSPTPWHLKCSYCKEKVKLSKLEFEAFLFALFLGVVAGSGLAHYEASSLTYAIVLTMTVIVFEYLLYIASKTFGVTLEKKK